MRDKINHIKYRETAFKIIFTIASVLAVTAGALDAEERPIYTLPALLDLSLQNNLSYRSAEKQVESKQYELSVIRRYPNPDLAFSFGYGWNGNEKGMENSISVNQQVIGPKQRKYKIAEGEREIEIAGYSKDWQKQILYFEVKKNFYKLLFLEKKYNLYAAYMHSLEKMLSAAEYRRSSIQDDLTIAKLKSELLRAGNEEEGIMLALGHCRSAINKLTGMTAGNNFGAEGNWRSFPENLSLDFFIKQAKINNPLLLKEERQLRLRKTDILLEKTKRIPKFSTGIFYQNEIDKESAGIEMSFPFPLWDNNSARISRSASLLQKTESDKEAYEDKLTVSLKDLYRKEDRLLKKEKASKKLLKQTEKVLHLTELLYRQGKVNVFGLLDSKRDYLKCKEKYYKTLYGISVTASELEQLSGVELP